MGDGRMGGCGAWGVGEAGGTGGVGRMERWYDLSPLRSPASAGSLVRTLIHPLPIMVRRIGGWGRWVYVEAGGYGATKFCPQYKGNLCLYQHIWDVALSYHNYVCNGIVGITLIMGAWDHRSLKNNTYKVLDLALSFQDGSHSIVQSLAIRFGLIASFWGRGPSHDDFRVSPNN